jgi:hypothetical protein
VFGLARYTFKGGDRKIEREGRGWFVEARRPISHNRSEALARNEEEARGDSDEATLVRVVVFPEEQRWLSRDKERRQEGPGAVENHRQLS